MSRAFDLGAVHYILKPYLPDVLFRRVIEAYHFERRGTLKGVSKSQPREFIIRTLDSMNIKHALLGYRFIVEAVEICIEDPDMLRGVTKILYPQIAKKYKSRGSRVERGIRHAITTIWDQDNGHSYRKFIGSTSTKKPTNSSFIASIVDRYKFLYSE